MRSYIYKTIIFSLALILIFEFTIGRRFNQINEKIERFSSKEGRKDTIASLKKEIKAEEPKEKTSQTTKWASKVSKANKAIAKPAESPLINGSSFFNIFIFTFHIITLYTIIYYIKFND